MLRPLVLNEGFAQTFLWNLEGQWTERFHPSQGPIAQKCGKQASQTGYMDGNTVQLDEEMLAMDPNALNYEYLMVRLGVQLKSLILLSEEGSNPCR